MVPEGDPPDAWLESKSDVIVGKRHDRGTPHRRKADLTWNNHDLLNGHPVDLT